MKDLNIEEQIYLCKYHDIDKSWGFEKGYTQKEVDELIEKYKKNGLYEQYRNMDEFEYEKICKQEKSKDKYQKILDKYKFDNKRSTYKRMLEVLRESKNVKKTNELNVKDICRRVAIKHKVLPHVITNDCKRAVEAAYNENQNLFKLYGYEKKPTLKEFIIRELKLEKNDNSVICDITEAEETKKEQKTVKNIEKEAVTSEKITLDSKIEIPLKELLDYYYLKGFVDASEGNELKNEQTRFNYLRNERNESI